MANPEHVKVVKAGTLAIDEWRVANQGETLDLRNADLEQVDLSPAMRSGGRRVEAFLEGAVLIGANMKGAVLREARLTRAKLDRVDLSPATGQDGKEIVANLERAVLNDAVLCGAVLKKANLRGASLERVDLCPAPCDAGKEIAAVLEEAVLVGATLDGAILIEAKMSGAVLTSASLNDAHLIGAHLEGADLRRAKLNNAKLMRAHLENAKLEKAKLIKADFDRAHLNGANLHGANLGRANLSEVHLEGTYARFVVVDGETIIDKCIVDDATDFTGVGLSSARIEPAVLIQLRNNIRRFYWTGQTFEQTGEKLIEDRGWRQQHPVLWCPVFVFWWASNFGSSTSKLLRVFLGLSLIFSCVYLSPTPAPSWAFWPTFRCPEPFVDGLTTHKVLQADGKALEIPLPWGSTCARAIYFSVVTMTTLGFGDITAHPTSVIGHFLVSLQVLLGYFILAALVVRIGIMFQELS